MGIINFSIPKELVKEILKNVEIENFVETGTFKGDTSIWAAKHFEKVYTIEIDKNLSDTASKRNDVNPNIKFLVGNSKDVLPDLTIQLKGKTFFWLDGHYCVGAGGIEDECPLLDELKVISELREESFLFIDDARCYMGPLPSEHNSSKWPRIDTIFEVLKERFPQNSTTIIDDVIISVPKQFIKIIDDYWQATYQERYYNPSYDWKRFSKLKIIKALFT